jgi:hypothetical protein
MEPETSSAEDGGTQGNKKERVKAGTVVSKTGARPSMEYEKAGPQPPKHITERLDKIWQSDIDRPLSEASAVDPKEGSRNYNHIFFRLMDEEVDRLLQEGGNENVAKAKLAVSNMTVRRTQSGTLADRHEALISLKKNHKDIWEEVTMDKRFKKVEEEPTASKKDKPKRKNKSKLLSGNKEYIEENISPLFPSLPVRMGLIVDNIPVHIMINLILQYGNPDFVKEFNEKSEAIVISVTDQLLIKGFTERVSEAGNKLSGKKKGTETDGTGTSAAVVFAKGTEESLQNNEIFELGRSELEYPDNLMRPQVIERRAQEIFEKTVSSDVWKGSKDLAAYRNNTIRQQLPEDLFECVERLHIKYGIDSWWLRQNRTRYLLHHWYVLPDKALNGQSVECSDVEDTGSASPLDCTLQNTSGFFAISALDYLVRSILGKVFGMEVGCSTAGAADKKTVENVLQEKIAFYPGILKTGRREVHQALHIDNRDLMGSPFLERILGGDYESITDKEWLNGGYVIDLPLSAEGSWLRVAIPDATKKKFTIEWVFIPFGSFVIRSAALFHSGHYGSPGNTRFHAVVFVSGTKTNTSELGYIEALGKGWRTAHGTIGLSVACEWEVSWNESVDHVCRNANQARSYTNDEVRRRKKAGTTYAKELLAIRFAQQRTFWWMLNPVPEGVSFEKKWKRKRKQGDKMNRV